MLRGPAADVDRTRPPLPTADLACGKPTHRKCEALLIASAFFGFRCAGALRIRRFQVRRSFRGRSIGRRLVDVLLESPRRAGRVAVFSATGGPSPSWETLGFKPDACDGLTPILLPSRTIAAFSICLA
jgi:GNAT superfamily N-acetyltransferase